jgi:hypothetical protein
MTVNQVQLQSNQEQQIKLKNIIHGDQSEGYIFVTDYASTIEPSVIVNDNERLSNVIAELETKNKDTKNSVTMSLNVFNGMNRQEQNCIAVNGIFIDIDTQEGTHNAADIERYPKTNQIGIDTLDIITESPTVVVNSGGGLHVYYLFDKPFTIESEAQRKYIKEVIREFGLAMKDSFDKLGYHLDITFDLSKTVRLPGTFNKKYNRLVKLIDIHGERFSVQDIEKMTQQMRKAAPKELSQSNQSNQNFVTSPIDPYKVNQKCKQIENSWTSNNDVWVKAIQTLSQANVLDHENVIHELSSSYPGYNRKETQDKINFVKKKNYSPVTCISFEKHNSELCKTCEHNGKIKSPIQLGRDNVIQLHNKNNANEHYQNIILKSDYYNINEYGFLEFQKLDSKGEFEKYIPISNFVAKVEREIIEDNGQETIRQIELSGVLEGKETLRKIKILAKDFEFMQWVVAEWGTKCNIKPDNNAKNRLRSAIQDFSKDSTVEYIYTHLGWREIDGKWVYLHNGGAIGAEGVKVNLQQDGLQKYMIPEGADDLQKAIRSSFDLLNVADHEITYPLLAMVGLAPLCEPLKKAGIEPSFVLWLLGISGSRKSTLAALFLSHFGDFNGKTLPAGFKDSANAIEKKAFLTKDSILVVDDYHPKATLSEAKRIEDIAQQLLRGYGDHHGRTRMKPDGTLRKAYIPQGLCIVTGEDTPTAGTSTTSRYISVEFNSDSVNLDELSKAQQDNNKLKLGQSMRGYLEWLASKMDALSQSLKILFENFRAETIKRDNSQHGRLPETVAWLSIGLNTFLQYAIENNILTHDEAKKMIHEGYKMFVKMSQKHSESIQSDTPVKQFLKAIRELKATNKIYFEQKSEAFNSNEFGELVGYYDHNYYYLMPETIHNLITQFYAKQNRNFNITSQMLLKHLENENLIHCQMENGQLQRTVRLRIKGGRKRLVWLKRSALDGLDEVEELDEVHSI